MTRRFLIVGAWLLLRVMLRGRGSADDATDGTVHPERDDLNRAGAPPRDVAPAVAQRAATTKRSRHPFWELALSASIALAVIVYIGGPTVEMVRSARATSDEVADRKGVPAHSIGPAERDLISEFAAPSGPVVLTYHDLSEREGPWTVTPREFERHMAILHAAGFRTVSTDDFIAHLNGDKRLPERSLYLTFDDGARSARVYGDLVLERYGFTATAFIVTGLVGTNRYYLNWAEIDTMRRSGRWSFENHSHRGHTSVAVSSDRERTGVFAPFFTNRQWLAGADRVETSREAKARIRKDLDRSQRMFALHNLPIPRLFAYPFGAAFAPTNDSHVAASARREVLKRFQFALLTNVSSCVGADDDSRFVNRLSVHARTSPASLLEAIEGLGALRVARDSRTSCDHSAGD